MNRKTILRTVVLCILSGEAVCSGIDYYIDAESGDDANAGTSTGTAWRTVAKVNSRTFSPGDRVLFRRGQLWREQLIVSSSGAAGRPITFGTYGTGGRAVLKGSALVTGWTSSGSNQWRASLSSTPNQVFFNGARGTKVSGTAAVNGALKWYWSGGTLYVYSASNPGSTIEASVRPSTRSYGLVHIQGREYVNIEGLEITQSASFGLYVKPAARYITIRDCDVSHALDGGLVVPTGSSSAQQITVEDCLVHHNNGGFKEGAPGVATYHEGLTMENVDGFTIRRTKVYSNYMEGSNFKRGARNGVIEYCDLYANDLINQYIEGATNIVVRFNRIYDCSYNAGIEFGMETNTYHNDNIRICHNLFWNNSGGVSFWAGGFTGQHRNIRIENNTFYNNWEAIRWKSGATDNYSGTNYIRNNVLWQNKAANRAIWDYTAGSQAISRTTISHNVFQQGCATATTGVSARVIADPYFTNPASMDFRLRSGSSCIDAGLGVGLTADIMGTPIPQGGGPDIGAYEYGSGAAPAPNPTTYTLSVSASNGTVTRTPNKTSYTTGETVALQAVPNTGYTFTGWSGALTGSANPASLVMDANKSVTANFTAAGGGGGDSTSKTVGNTTVFTGGATVGIRRAMPYRMPEAGQLQSVTIYHNGGTGQMLLGVYGDSSGRPGARLGATNATTVNGTQGWQTVSLQSPVSVSSGQTIWLAWVFQNSVGVRATAGTPGRADSTATWTSGMPTTYGASTVGNYIYSIYATYSTGTVPAPATYTLTTSATNGTVTRTPNKTSYTAGETVTLQAVPSSGYAFAGWSGALSGSTNPATVVMDANRSVTANFTLIPPKTYTLSTSAANGTITRTPNKTSYTAGETVTLQAVANSGYAFTGWTGALSGSTNPAQVVMDGNKSVTAGFTALNSGVTKTVGNTTVFTGGATVAIRRAMPYRMPEAGQLQSISLYHGGGTGRVLMAVYADSAGKPGARLGVTSATTVNRTQGWQTVALQSPVSASSGQTIWLAWVFEGTVWVRATAGTPGRADSAATWTSGMPTTYGASTVGNYIYSIYATYRTGTAPVAPSTYTLSTSATNGAITRTPNKTSYTAGETVTLQAVPNSGYTFAGWSGSVSGSTNPAALVMDAGKSVTANFAPIVSATKTVGYTSVFSSITTVGNRRAALYAMPEAGQLQSITIYHQGGTGRMILGVYGDSAGKPGARLGVTSAVTINRTQGWQTVALPSPVFVSAGQRIWLAWVFENCPGVRAMTGTPGRADTAAYWGGGMPTTFGVSSVSNYIYSIYATYGAGSYKASHRAVAADATDDGTRETAATPTPWAADARESQRTDLASDGIWTEALGPDRRLCVDPAGRNQGSPATVTDTQGNTWVAWHAGAAGERQVQLAGFFPLANGATHPCR